jgi:hypothetical protein
MPYMTDIYDDPKEFVDHIEKRGVCMLSYDRGPDKLGYAMVHEHGPSPDLLDLMQRHASLIIVYLESAFPDTTSNPEGGYIALLQGWDARDGGEVS